MVKWYLGTMGFGWQDWAGPFYPEDADQRDYLCYYSRVFNSVEVDSTFYGTPRPEVVERWDAITPPDFCICAKMPKSITHEHELVETDQLVTEFLDEMRRIGDKLGVILIQFPPSFTVLKRAKLSAFLEKLPHDIQFAVETRHRSWYTDKTADMFREYNIAWAATEYRYLPKRIYRTYGFFNNDYSGFSAATCNQFKAMFGFEVGVQEGSMSQVRFTKYAWGVLAYNVLVVLWGALVRATGSGAGCGNHWPTCNGQVLPEIKQIETAVEFTHRIMSGFALIFIAVLLIWAFRSYSKGSTVRLGAVLSMVFIFTEALVGAGLVLFRWVGMDQSLGRTISIAIHLVNTFLLLGSISLTAWWASGGAPLRLHGQGISLLRLVIGLLGVIILGVTGAITALGDTLFPASSLAQGISQDFSPNVSFLIHLRVWHPVIAITVGFYLVFLSSLLALQSRDRRMKRYAWIMGGLFVLQLIAGLVNVLLLAPVWMQIVHLLLADLVWISLVLLSASVLGIPNAETQAAETQAGRLKPQLGPR